MQLERYLSLLLVGALLSACSGASYLGSSVLSIYADAAPRPVAISHIASSPPDSSGGFLLGPPADPSVSDSFLTLWHHLGESGALPHLAGLLLLTTALLHLVISLIAIKRYRRGSESILLLAIYTTIAFVWMLHQAAMQLGWLPAALVPLQPRLFLYEILLLTTVYFHLNQSFLRRSKNRLAWWGIGGAWILSFIALDQGILMNQPAGMAGSGRELALLGTPLRLDSQSSLTLAGSSLPAALQISGWAFFVCAALVSTLRTYRLTRQPLHRNRLTFWTVTLILTILGDLLLFANGTILGAIIRLLSTASAAYSILAHHLPNVRRTLRRILSYATVLLLALALYINTFLLVDFLLNQIPGYDPFWPHVVLALLLALLFNPLLRLVQGTINRLDANSSYDPARTVRRYSMSLTNSLTVERLAATAIELIGEVLGARGGILFLIERESGPDGKSIFHLRAVHADETGQRPTLSLTEGNPFVRCMRREYRPLTQYEIDLFPQFRSLPNEERSWFTARSMDVYVPIYAQGEWHALLAIGPKEGGNCYYEEDLALLCTLADQTAVALENTRLLQDLVRLNEELAEAYDTTLAGWSRVLDLRDKETEGHSQRVSELTLRLARVMGLSEDELIHIRRGALLHDIGKMGVPDNILLKPGPLTEEEREIMSRHPLYAYKMLSPITFLHDAMDIPYCHHEKWDGTGYPRRLRGEEIPLAARIFAVVDVWDALRSDRPYRKALPTEEVRAYIRAQAGRHFDPKIVEAFLQLSDLDDFYQETPAHPPAATGQACEKVRPDRVPSLQAKKEVPKEEPAERALDRLLHRGKYRGIEGAIQG